MWKSQQHQHHQHQHQRRHVGCSAKTRAGVNTGAHWSNAPLVFFLPDETHSRTAGRGVYQPVSRRCRQRAIRVARGDGEKAREYSCLGPPPYPNSHLPPYLPLRLLVFYSDIRKILSRPVRHTPYPKVVKTVSMCLFLRHSLFLIFFSLSHLYHLNLALPSVMDAVLVLFDLRLAVLFFKYSTWHGSAMKSMYF